MKTRFLTALTHELPGADFPPGTRLSRLRPLRVSSTPAEFRHPGRTRMKRQYSEPLRPQPAPHDWWRFAGSWRNKEVDNFASAASRRTFFRCWATGLASIAVLLLA